MFAWICCCLLFFACESTLEDVKRYGDEWCSPKFLLEHGSITSSLFLWLHASAELEVRLVRVRNTGIYWHALRLQGYRLRCARIWIKCYGNDSKIGPAKRPKNPLPNCRRRWTCSSKSWSFAALGKGFTHATIACYGTVCWWLCCLRGRPDRMITATKGFIAYKLSDYYVQPPSLVYDKIFERLDQHQRTRTTS